MKITANVSEEDKVQFERICTAVGLDMSTAIGLFIKATIRKNGIPFPIVLNSPCCEANLDALRDSIRFLPFNDGL